MATEKSNKKKLTPRQHAFVKNLTRGASQKDAFIAAGYKAKHPDQGAHQALKQIQGKVPQIMDQIGLTDHFLIEKYLVPLLEAEETKGSIVLTTGIAGQRPQKGWVIAASVCGTIEALTRALAVELAPIRVNAVSPGVVRTNL
jgi:NAD(P)-dependent dehydrogenase (short-subunit alcohol dehydrogenase family)